MKMYYYDPTDVVWSAWSNSQLKQWLVDHGIVKSDAQTSINKMIKMGKMMFHINPSYRETFFLCQG